MNTESERTPTVSIVTPLFNSESYIRETVESVMAQTYESWELLVIDDASTDGGPAVVRELAAKDSRIRLISLPVNSGAGVSRNTGIRHADGRFIAFLDSDDRWLPVKLDVQIRFMLDHGFPFSFTDYRKVTEGGTATDRVVRCLSRLTYRRQLMTNYVGCSTAVYDTACYGKRFFPDIRKRQDFALWLELLRNGPPGRGINQPLTLYRVRTGGLSGRKLELLKYNWLLYRRVLGFSRIASTYFVMWNILIKIIGRR